ncbi:O-antigen ligase family protein [Alphaproteobacteria bacterium]|nr:O-antigen ligase family protein [Alphaproteobacteria bacterium]
MSDPNSPNLRHFSDQLGLKAQARRLWTDMRAALDEMSAWDRGVHIFWLLGPFILLIERTPADIWLSFIALAFAARSILLRQGAWLQRFWVRAAFAFWAVCLIAALASSLPAYSFGEAFVWFRFPLFAMATTFWLARDKRLLYAMLASTAIGIVLMCGILTAEIVIVGQQGGRLSWPYGDLVPGNYLAKAGLPAFTIAVALAVSVRGRLATIAAFFALISMVLSLVTGERINFLIRACGGMLAALVWKPKLRRFALLVALEALAVVVAFQMVPQLGNRFIDTFVEQLPTAASSPYYRAIMPGVLAAQQSPVLGVGPGNLRHMCVEIVAGAPNMDCHPHPHNFYIQIAGEVGLVGLIFAVVFIGAMIWACFSANLRNRANVVAATAFIVPFGFFWPIASTADFFGQWNNLFMWSALALSLAACNLAPDKSPPASSPISPASSPISKGSQ